LIIGRTLKSQLWSFQGAREPSSPNERTPARVRPRKGTTRSGLSKLNSERRLCRGRR
jgi:hypothetical protein